MQHIDALFFQVEHAIGEYRTGVESQALFKEPHVHARYLSLINILF